MPTAVDANDYSFTLVLLELSAAFKTVEQVVLLLGFYWENPKVKFRLCFLCFFFLFGVKSQISLKLVKHMREFDQSAYFFFFVCHRRIEHIGSVT